VNAALSDLESPKTSVQSIADKWEFIDSGYNSGKFNMDFDLDLVGRCENEVISFLRFYRWKPFAISLGYNQTKFIRGHRIDLQKCSEDNIDVVQRPTGGRAVLHSQELTYSVVMKSNKPVRLVYREISLALLSGLKSIDRNNSSLQELSFTISTPDLLRLSKTGMYNLCFNTAIKDEINYRGKKLVGSAQRKLGDVILQHGSVLIGEHHKNIVEYLSIEERNVKNRLKQEIEEKTICLNQLLRRKVTYEETAEALYRGFEETLGVKLS
jgi:lipoate-protein ligase A